METNKIVRKQILQIVKNQLESNNPPETKINYDRLKKEGFDDLETKQLIGQCVSVEIFDTLKYGKPFNNARYVKNLNELPKEPFE